jgi:hypothetical protein
MADSSAPTSDETAVPLLADFLGFLGFRCQYPDPALDNHKVLDVIVGVTVQIHRLTGIPIRDIIKTIIRLGSGKILEPTRRCTPLVEAFFGAEYAAHFASPEPDLSYVARELHLLDRDGAAARIWRGVHWGWPEVANAYRTAVHQRDNATELLPPNFARLPIEQISLSGRVTTFLAERVQATGRLPTLKKVREAFSELEKADATFYRNNPWYTTARAALKQQLHEEPRRGHQDVDDDGNPVSADASMAAPDYYQDEG